MSVLLSCDRKSSQPVVSVQQEREESKKEMDSAPQKESAPSQAEPKVEEKILAFEGREHFDEVIRKHHIQNMSERYIQLLQLGAAEDGSVSYEGVQCAHLCTSIFLEKNAQWAQSALMAEKCVSVMKGDWKNILATGEENTAIGGITCQIVPSEVIHGRAPLAMRDCRIAVQDIASYYARRAQEEALSIFSFAELYVFLKQIDAPHSVQERCVKAMQEERSHTEMSLKIARRYDQEIEPIIAIPQKVKRSFFEVVYHNAMVGCIQETWAALLDTYQARHTRYHQNVHGKIAKDEQEHAQLAWDLHRWCMAQLSIEEQRSVRSAMREKLREDRHFVMMNHAEIEDLGFPSKDTRKRLFVRFRDLIQVQIAA